MHHNNDTISDWIISNRLYEDNLFYYALIIFSWFFIGFVFLGFEIDGFSQQQNLFFNFLFYLVICLCMALCSFWFKLFFSKTHTAQREQELTQALEKLNDNDRASVKEYLAHTGGLAMRPIQKWALVFLGAYCLFEVFFISAWVKNMALVWQPDWASVLIEWVRANTDFVSDEGVNHQLFMVRIKPENLELYRLYASEREFLASDFGGATALFQIFRSFLVFPFCLLSLAIILWKPLNWLGFSRIDPRNIHSFGSFMFASIATLVTTFFLLLVFYFKALGVSATILLGIEFWKDNFYMNFSLVFMILAMKSIVGWFVFWKQIIFKN